MDKIIKAMEERELRSPGTRYTKFLKMYLPGENEFYRVEEDQNQNFEKIDGALENAQKMAIDLFSKKQDKQDNKLQTDAKQIVPAINELNNIKWDNNNCRSSTGRTGYILFPNNLLVQWGYVGFNKQFEKSITYPIAFKETPTVVLGRDGEPSESFDVTVDFSHTNDTKAGVKLKTNTKGLYIYTNWVAIGGV